MINRNKIFITATIVIICLVIIVSFIFCRMLFSMPISKPNMEKEFKENKNIILSIKDYLEKQKYSSIYITSTDDKGKMFASTDVNEVGKLVSISNVSISGNISYLFKKKYQVITKKNNYIYFQRWSNREYGRGILFSLDGAPPKNKLIIKLEPLSEKDWYFYEEK